MCDGYLCNQRAPGPTCPICSNSMRTPSNRLPYCFTPLCSGRTCDTIQQGGQQAPTMASTGTTYRAPPGAALRECKRCLDVFCRRHWDYNWLKCPHCHLSDENTMQQRTLNCLSRQIDHMKRYEDHFDQVRDHIQNGPSDCCFCYLPTALVQATTNIGLCYVELQLYPPK